MVAFGTREDLFDDRDLIMARSQVCQAREVIMWVIQILRIVSAGFEDDAWAIVGPMPFSRLLSTHDDPLECRNHDARILNEGRSSRRL